MPIFIQNGYERWISCFFYLCQKIAMSTTHAPIIYLLITYDVVKLANLNLFLAKSLVWLRPKIILMH